MEWEVAKSALPLNNLPQNLTLSQLFSATGLAESDLSGPLQFIVRRGGLGAAPQPGSSLHPNRELYFNDVESPFVEEGIRGKP